MKTLSLNDISLFQEPIFFQDFNALAHHGLIVIKPKIHITRLLSNQHQKLCQSRLEMLGDFLDLQGNPEILSWRCGTSVFMLCLDKFLADFGDRKVFTEQELKNIRQEYRTQSANDLLHSFCSILNMEYWENTGNITKKELMQDLASLTLLSYLDNSDCLPDNFDYAHIEQKYQFYDCDDKVFYYNNSHDLSDAIYHKTPIVYPFPLLTNAEKETLSFGLTNLSLCQSERTLMQKAMTETILNSPLFIVKGYIVIGNQTFTWDNVNFYYENLKNGEITLLDGSYNKDDLKRMIFFYLQAENFDVGLASHGEAVKEYVAELLLGGEYE